MSTSYGACSSTSRTVLMPTCSSGMSNSLSISTFKQYNNSSNRRASSMSIRPEESNNVQRRDSLPHLLFHFDGQRQLRPRGDQDIEECPRDEGEHSSSFRTMSRHHQHASKVSAWSCVYEKIWSTLRGAFKKESKLSEVDLFNEACAVRLAAHYGASKLRGRRELDLLLKRTEFSRNELKLLYWGWKCACPSGILTEATFKDIYAQFFPQAGRRNQPYYSAILKVVSVFSGDSSLYAHYVYRAMFGDKAKQDGGQVRFSDYVLALSQLSKGSTKDKLEWTFRLYDLNGDGLLTLDELTEISRAIYGLLGFYVSPGHDHRTVDHHARRVYQKLDADNVGHVTLDQFLLVCTEDSNIVESMQLLDTQGLE
ncbi:Kv channel-interacting protein 1 [Halotydeus destructor]|nr:Kv channel-interacting protein 1 [Halotydeus destructor]